MGVGYDVAVDAARRLPAVVQPATPRDPQPSWGSGEWRLSYATYSYPALARPDEAMASAVSLMRRSLKQSVEVESLHAIAQR